MRNDHYLLVVHYFLAYLIIPEGCNTIDGIFYGFNAWQRLLWNKLILRLVTRMPKVMNVNTRSSCIKATSPVVKLLL